MKARDLVTPLALVLVAAGTAAYAYLVDRDKVSDADRAARKRDVFPSFRVEDVSRLELTHDAESMVLERDPGTDGGVAGWVMRAPRTERADPAAVDMLLRELELGVRLRDVTAGDGAELDAPRTRGKIQVGALEYRFALGADAARPEGAAYMRVDGEGTFVVGRSLKVQLLRGADAYRERAVVPYGASSMARLEVRTMAGESFALERAGATFRVADQGLRASRQAVDALFTALADGRAETFLDDAVADQATEKPAFTVVLTPRDATHRRMELRVGGACPGQPSDVVVVRDTPRLSACTAHTLVEALETPAADLVDTSPFFAHADEIEELRLERVDASGQAAQSSLLRVEAVRKGNGWHERSPEDRDLTSDETDSANLLALALAGARGTDVRRASASGEHLDARARVTLVRTGGETREVVEVGTPAADGTVLLRRADDGATLRVPRAVARRFEPHPIALHARAVWAAPLETGAVVAVEDTCTPTPERLELRDRTWTLRAPPGLPADGASVADLLGTLARMKSDGWIAETDDGGFGFDGPGACAVTLTLDGGEAGPRRAAVRLGAAGDGGFYARAQDDGAVFVASAGLRQALVHPAIDRSRVHLETGPGWSITVVHAGARRTVSADAAGDDRLAEALAGFFAQSALHAGPAPAAEGLDHPTLELVATGRSEAGAPVETRVVVGAETQVDEAAAYFARVSGIDATFAVPRPRVTAILDAL